MPDNDRRDRVNDKLNDVYNSTFSPDSDIQKQARDIENTGKDAAGVGRDIYKTFRSNKDKFTAKAGTVGAKSVVGKASKNIFEFPVFVSSSVPLDYATAICSLVEQNYASFVQMAISMNPVITKKDLKAGKMFETFRSDTAKYLEYAEMDYAKDACHNVIRSDDLHHIFEFDMLSITDTQAKWINEALDNPPMSEFEHFFQETQDNNDYDAYTDNGYASSDSRKSDIEQEKLDWQRAEKELDRQFQQMQHQFEQEKEARRQSMEERKEARETEKDTREEARAQRREAFDTEKERRRIEENERDYQMNWMKTMSQIEKNNFDKWAKETELKHNVDKFKWQQLMDSAKYYYQLEQDKKKNKLNEKEFQQKLKEFAHKQAQDAARNELDIKKDTREEEAHKAKMQYDAQRFVYDSEKHHKDMKVKAPELMDETKINKLNTMKPLMMNVELRVMSDEGTISGAIEYMIGVKARCRIVKADVLPDVAEYPLKNMALLTRRAKWRAGEIKLMDYLFARKEKKQAAYDSRDTKRKWYHRLYTLAHSKGSKMVAGMVTGINTRDGLVPNATIIISKADVDMIDRIKKIDLLKGSTARKFCNELFLMSLVVIDDDAQSVKILYPDRGDAFEVHSMASVNKQLATLDTSGTVSREVSKLMSGR